MKVEKKEVEHNNSKDVNESLAKDKKREEIINKHSSMALVTAIVVVLIIFLLIANLIVNSIVEKNDVTTDISKVKKILNEKYSDISCVDKTCKYVVATNGDSLNKMSYSVFNLNGQRVIKYNVNYSKKDIKNVSITYVTESYFITEEITNNKVFTYTLRSKSGKPLYSTDKKLVSLGNNYIAYESEKDKYTIIDNKGKIKFSNINGYESYADGKYIFVKYNDKYSIINSKGETVLSNYKVDKEIKNNNSVIFLVVKDIQTNLYYYFDIEKGETILEGFNNYKVDSKNEGIVVTSYDGDKKVNYGINNKGKKVDILGDNSSLIESKIQKEIDSENYFLYSYGLKNSKQKYVLVDNKKEKTFGILNVKTNKYSKLYSYSKDKSYYYSSIKQLNSKDENYVMITCPKSNCGKTKTYVYDLNNKNLLFKSTDNNKVIKNYVEYENEYKVVTYTDSSKNNYVLYDSNNNKKLLSEDNNVTVVNSKIKIGKIIDSRNLLYDTSKKKFVNNKKTLANIINIGDSVVYRYEKNNNTKFYDEKGSNILNVSEKPYLSISNSNLIVMADGKINIYNTNKNKLRKYKLRENEKLNDSSDKIISPYRSAIFINNSDDNKIKIINSKARVIRSIDNSQIYSIERNKVDGTALIIVRKGTSSGDLYGLYVAK